MTVRTWITLSALILVALTVAIFVRLLAPVAAPPVFARVGDVRIEGQLVEACWPQRRGELRCERNGDDVAPATVPQEGTLRIIVAYPAQPEEGRIEIRRAGEREPAVSEPDWEEEIDYDLEPGRYELTARAEYPQDAHISYRFPFTVR